MLSFIIALTVIPQVLFSLSLRYYIPGGWWFYSGRKENLKCWVSDRWLCKLPRDRIHLIMQVADTKAESLLSFGGLLCIEEYSAKMTSKFSTIVVRVLFIYLSLFLISLNLKTLQGTSLFAKIADKLCILHGKVLPKKHTEIFSPNFSLILKVFYITRLFFHCT